MKKSQVDHILSAARDLTSGERKFIIIGSQALHGKHPDLVDKIAPVSREVDLYVPRKNDVTEILNFIGEGSQFHETHGYYADPVDEKTAVLPKGWKSRLINLPPGDTEGAIGLCLEPHDLAISKYVAGRKKDRQFTRALVLAGILDRDVLAARLAQTPLDEAVRRAAQAAIERDFLEASSREKPAQGSKKKHRGRE